MLDYLETRDTYVHGYGHYHEKYVKEANGAWRIKWTRLTRLRVDIAPKAPAETGAA